MKLKKWLPALAAFAAMVVLCAVCAGAETYGDLEYSVLDDGTVEITDYNGIAKTVDIPEKINGKSVTSIGNCAFRYCTSLKSITIPNSVMEIGSSAFSGCSSLTSITIPNSVTEIGVYAFKGCTSLTSITIPNSVTNIGDSTFWGCSSLTAIYVAVDNKNYTSVNGVLFNKDKTALICYPAGKTDKSYNITNSVTSIGDYAFNGCSSLTSVTIPNSVTEIGGSAFVGCASLKSITMPNSVTSIGDMAFYKCSSLTSITIPDSVTSIGSSAFSDCSKLRSITIPNSVTSIGAWAFNGCTGLTAINVAMENQNYVSPDGVLYNKDKTTIICYPAGKKGNNYKIPDGVTEIGSIAFSRCSSLTSVTIPNSVTSIGSGAFNGCTSLTRVTIPNSVTKIGWNAFSGCTSLTSITIPNSVISIDWYAFMGCTSLKSITIPNSVTSIGKNAFGYYYDNGYKKINNLKIYCYSSTAGEQYAKDNGFDYMLIDKFAHAKVNGAKLGGRAADALKINWTKNASADGYIVEMYQNGKWARVGKITNNSTTTFRKAGLKASTVYKFRVKAYKMCGTTAFYSAYSATVGARTNPSVMTGAKLGGRAADALRINWTKNASADGYIVEMYQGNKWVRVGKVTNNSTTTFRKAGLKASKVYKFRVRAYKMSGKTALYGNFSATVTARTNPSIMKGVKIAGKAKDALRVNWTKNASAQGYIVEMYKGRKWVRVAKITNGNTTTFRKAGLAKNTTYKFRVRAYHMSGKTALYGNYGSVSGKTAVK
jgi:pyruvoyl-dependent arginine decarboxylase (PvlArgDC)